MSRQFVISRKHFVAQLAFFLIRLLVDVLGVAFQIHGFSEAFVTNVTLMYLVLYFCDVTVLPLDMSLESGLMREISFALVAFVRFQLQVEALYVNI